MHLGGVQCIYHNLCGDIKGTSTLRDVQCTGQTQGVHWGMLSAI